MVDVIVILRPDQKTQTNQNTMKNKKQKPLKRYVTEVFDYCEKGIYDYISMNKPMRRLEFVKAKNKRQARKMYRKMGITFFKRERILLWDNVKNVK